MNMEMLLIRNANHKNQIKNLTRSLILFKDSMKSKTRDN